jgi:uncharacterized membrane protein YecN with MAPEG domain
MPTLPFHAGPLTHSPFYVALLLLFVTLLALNSSRNRLRTQVFFGDGGDEPLHSLELLLGLWVAVNDLGSMR